MRESSESSGIRSDSIEKFEKISNIIVNNLHACPGIISCIDLFPYDSNQWCEDCLSSKFVTTSSISSCTIGKSSLSDDILKDLNDIHLMRIEITRLNKMIDELYYPMRKKE